jgi:capsular polysaccharide biosynthesis protein
MNFVQKKSFTTILKKYAAVGIVAGIVVSIIAVLTAYALQEKYRADADLLIVQKDSENKDFYTAFKSSEYIGNVLANAVGSERFLDAVAESGALDLRSLPSDKSGQLKAWRSMVSVKKNLELGVLSVSVKADDERVASRIASGVMQVLMEKNSLFRGGDDGSIEIRVLSGPITEQNIDMKKLIEIISGGFFSGFLTVMFLVVARNEARVRYAVRMPD